MKMKAFDRRQFLELLGLGISSVMVPNTYAFHNNKTKMSNVPEILKDFNNIPIFDSHFHILSNMERVDYIVNLKEIIKACGLSALNVLSVSAHGDPSQNLVTALAKVMYPENVYGFGGLSYRFPATSPELIDLADQAEKLIEIGFDGFKMIEGKPSVRKKIGHRLDGPIYDGYYALAESTKMPILFHVADPWSASKPPAEMETLYRETDGVLAKFPNLHIIFAHFFFMGSDLERAGRFLDKWPHISFDLTPGPDMYGPFSKNPDKTRKFFLKYQDRIVFGTDNHAEARSFGPGAPLEYWPVYKMIAMRTFLETAKEFTGWHQNLRGIALEDKVLEKIYYKNFQRYVGTQPRKLNVDRALEVCERVLQLAKKYAIIHDIFPEIRRFIKEIKAL